MAGNGGNIMKRILALVLAIVMLAAVCVIPAMAADTGKNSPEKDETVVIPDSSTGTAVIDPDTTVEFNYNHPESHPYVYVFETEDGYALVWATSDDVVVENGTATLPENSYVVNVATLDEIEDIVYGKPTAVAVEIKTTLAAKSIVIDPSTVDDYYAKNVYTEGQKPDAPDDKPVTSPDTSDALSALIGALVLADAALICYCLKKKKVK